MKSNFIWLKRANGCGKFLANIDQILKISKINSILIGGDVICIDFADGEIYETITIDEFNNILLPRLNVLNKGNIYE